MINYVLAHPSLLLWLFPFLVAGAVSAIGKAEKYALARLLTIGDVHTQKAIHDTIKVWVVWAEEEYADPRDGTGSEKFAAVDNLLARALPFLSADQRRDLIEKAVKEMDAEANAALDAKKPDAPTGAGADQGSPQP